MKTARRSIRLIAVVITLMFLSIGVYLPYQLFLYQGAWISNANNPAIRHPKSVTRSGGIYDARQIQLASTAMDVYGSYTRAYVNDFAIRSAVAHVLGDPEHNIKGGVESTMAAYLLGFNPNFFSRIFRSFSGDPFRGDDVYLSLDAALTKYAASIFPSGKSGAIIIMNYKTGQIRAMTSQPSFDIANSAAGLAREVFINHATEKKEAPGSVFKTVVYAAALEYLPFVSERVFTCTGALQAGYGTIVEAGGKSHGSLTLEQAYAQSCNTTFADLAIELGWERLAKTAQKFGLNEELYIADIRMAESKFPFTIQSPEQLAQSGIGQSQVECTPMQMALVACAIANDGVVMTPRLLEFTKPQGQGSIPISNTVLLRSLSKENAGIIKKAMKAAVDSGTARNAAIPGMTVCGKTGSAEWGTDPKNNPTHSWFTGFIDDAKHPLAVCVLVEKGGSGSDVAAVIAREALLEALRLGY